MQRPKNADAIWKTPAPGASTKTDYEVGYRKPPADGRFKKGLSGNPKGRPRKTERSHTERQELRDLIEIFHEPTPITLNGKRRSLPLILCIFRQGMNQAAKGSFRHYAKAVDLYERTIALAQQLNPRPVNELESVEKTLNEMRTKIDRDAEEIVNEMRRKTRRI